MGTRMESLAFSIVCALAAALIALVTVLSIRSGRALWYPAMIQVSRAGQPGLFRVLVVAQFLAAAALGWLALA